MLQDERIPDDPLLVLITALTGWQSNMWTALPGIIESFDPVKLTCIVQPSIQAVRRSADNVISNITLPLLLDCPVVFPMGGGFTLTMPLAAGDECLVVFASRCIDAAWQSGGVQPQAEYRMHDLSDGFVVPGWRSQPRQLSGVSTTSAQLRSDDGATFVEVAVDRVNVVAPAQVNVTAPLVNIVAETKVTMMTPNVEITGRLSVLNVDGVSQPCVINGDIITNGDVIAGPNEISLVGHVHSGVQGGSSNTNPPVP